MDIVGQRRLMAPKTVVWAALNDTEILRRSIPGCETIEKISDSEFTARVVLVVGPVKAKFSGRVTLANLDPPNSYTIEGEGQGGIAGFGKGGAEIQLSQENDGHTILSYKAKATVGGKMAQLGARMIDSTTKKLVERFFENFEKAVSADAGTDTRTETSV
jgi:carbon monoxide dehydrogenase subunit G